MKGRYSPRSVLSTDEKKSLFLLALKELEGNISEACKVAQIGSRQTFYTWMDADDEFAFQVKSIQLDVSETLLDEAEGVIRFWIKRLDKQTAQWLLKQLGKRRGYGNKVEVEHTGDAFKDLDYPDEPTSVDEWEDKMVAEAEAEGLLVKDDAGV